MGQKTSLSVLAFNLALAVSASLVWTVPALADGGAPASGGSAPRSAPASGGSLTAGTKVVVVDSQGQKVPLGSQQAADILASGDPLWCPATVATPTPGVGGCTSPYADLYSLTNAIMTGAVTIMPVNGTIWIEGGPDGSASPVALNGSTLAVANATIVNFTLTLKGGWLGCSPGCVSTIDTGTPSSFNQTISIINWNNSVTLSNITISGASGTGLNVTTSKNISLTNVKSNSNTVDGASLDSSINSGTGSLTITGSQFNGNAAFGADITPGTGGAVAISASQFNGNLGIGYEGLYVHNSSGAVTLTNVTADSNSNGGGASIDNSAAASAAVLVNGTSNDFSSNKNDGLNITSRGLVTLTDVTASSNTVGYGVRVNNSLSAGHAGVTVAGSGTFNGNAQSGLDVLSSGLITANDLTASGNSQYGALLVNNNPGATGGVTLTGFNIFDGNVSEAGLQVDTFGAIKLNSLIANGNYDGVELDNCNLVVTCSTPTLQSITLTGSSQFINNSQNGLVAFSNGLITANNITADSNGGSFGADLANANTGVKAGVTLTGTNTFNNNTSYGLSVYSNGPVKLNAITADGNDAGHASLYYGANIDTSTGTSAASVTLTGVNTFDGNYDVGLYIHSAGAATAASVSASGSLSSEGTYVNAAGAVSFTGSNTFSGNHTTGLDVTSLGAITVNNLTASGNGTSFNYEDGATLDNSSAGSPMAVTLTGSNTFVSNVGVGLVIHASGAITTNNLTATGNGVVSSGGDGVYLNNTGGTGTVSVLGVNTLSGNFGSATGGGLEIASKGAISLNSITANANVHGYGVFADNCQISGGVCTAASKMLLTGTNVFDDNLYDGANLSSNATITASNVAANNNGAAGLNLNTFNGDSTPRPLAAISLGGVNSLNGNAGDGLLVTATGAISLSTLTVTNSGNIGVELDNTSLGTASIKLTTLSVSGSNTSGLYVRSHGAISGSNLTANGNDTSHSASWYGADLNTDASTITLTGTNVFKGNYDTNFYVYALGAISVSNLQASGSLTGLGAQIGGGDISTASPLILSGSSQFQNNWLEGLYVRIHGAITANNLTASGNGVSGTSGIGAELHNEDAPSAQKVTLTGTNAFNDNYDNGLSVQSLGAIAVNNVTANDSRHGSGAYLNVFSGSAPVSLTGTNTFDGNKSSGLIVVNSGAINASNLNVFSNGTTSASDGAYLSAGSGAVALTGTNVFDANGADGLYVLTTGSLSLTSTAADQNAQHGVSAGVGGNLSITCGSFNDNLQPGLNADMNNTHTLTLIGVTAAGNSPQDIATTGSPIRVTVRDCPLP